MNSVLIQPNTELLSLIISEVISSNQCSVYDTTCICNKLAKLQKYNEAEWIHHNPHEYFDWVENKFNLPTENYVVISQSTFRHILFCYTYTASQCVTYRSQQLLLLYLSQIALETAVRLV